MKSFDDKGFLRTAGQTRTDGCNGDDPAVEPERTRKRFL